MVKPIPGLYPVYVHPSGRFTNTLITLGALGDSFYEYLLKYYVMSGETKYRRMFEESVAGIKANLLAYSSPSKLLFINEMNSGVQSPKMDHLVCFAGGMYALSSVHIDPEHLEIGKEITKTCYEMYRRQPTGIAPELVRFEGDTDFYAPSGARHYLLRPETVESLFVLWRTTHDNIYREWGWEIFQAIETHCKTPNGYSGIRDVTVTNPAKDDLQQSFFMAETLKYLYLLFTPDDVIPLDKYVFNTEAHPLEIFPRK